MRRLIAWAAAPGFAVMAMAAAAQAQPAPAPRPLPPAPPAISVPVPDPDWIDKPVLITAPTRAEINAAMPKAAMEARLNGMVTLLCAADAEGRASRCEVLFESPRGLGFGAAAIGLKDRLVIAPRDEAGQAVAGRRWRAYIRFEAFDDPNVAPPYPTEQVYYPRFNDPPRRLLASHFPAAALTAGLSAQVAVSCVVNTAGRLEGCRVVSDSAAGNGFGEAALKLTGFYRAMTDKPGERVRMIFYFYPKAGQADVFLGQYGADRDDLPPPPVAVSPRIKTPGRPQPPVIAQAPRPQPPLLPRPPALSPAEARQAALCVWDHVPARRKADFLKHFQTERGAASGRLLGGATATAAYADCHVEYSHEAVAFALAPIAMKAGAANVLDKRYRVGAARLAEAEAGLTPAERASFNAVASRRESDDDTARCREAHARLAVELGLKDSEGRRMLLTHILTTALDGGL